MPKFVLTIFDTEQTVSYYYEADNIDDVYRRVFELELILPDECLLDILMEQNTFGNMDIEDVPELAIKAAIEHLREAMNIASIKKFTEYYHTAGEGYQDTDLWDTRIVCEYIEPVFEKI